MMRLALIISVIGGELAPLEARDVAEAVGRELAHRGVTIVCGGGGGVMEAVCRGARSQDGHTIGIMPGRDGHDSPPNQWVEFPIYTGLGYTRNSIVVLSGQAVIAVDGAYGTLSEIAYALMHDVPIIGLDTWDFDYHGHDADKIVRIDDPVKAVDKAIELAQQRVASATG